MVTLYLPVLLTNTNFYELRIICQSGCGRRPYRRRLFKRGKVFTGYRSYMKFTILFATLAFLSMFGLNAQSPQYSIFDILERPTKQGEGVVVIHQSDAIKKLVGTRIDSENVNAKNGKSFIATMGYRVRVYNGNNQRTSKDEMLSLEKQVKEKFPTIETYPEFVAPFWLLYVGNYLSYEEAYIMQRELRRIFPQRRNEINIFETNIQLHLD